MGEEVGADRSARFRELTTLAESSRRECARFDPAADDPDRAVREGVGPIVEAYVDCCRAGVDPSDVERSLLAGALNDWLRAYAAARDLPVVEGTAYSVHEVAMECARRGSVREATDSLVGP